MNFFKGVSGLTSVTSGWQGSLNADGYPTSTPTTDISGSIQLPSNYYGRYRVSFTGRGSIALSGQFIVYSGSSFVNTGNLTFELDILDQTNPTVEFAFGTAISGAANNGSGLIRLTVGSTLNVGTGAVYTVQGVTGTTEANGVWTVTVIDGTHLDLQGSTFTHAYVSGGEAIAQQASPIGMAIKASGTFTSFAGLVLCRKADIDGTNAFGLQAGYQCNADLVSQIQTLRPYAIRFLNLNGVINSLASAYSTRPVTTALTYNGDLVQYVPSYWVSGGIARGASDAYTCASPSASGTGAYADGETVQGIVDLTNLTNNPTLQLGTRGAKPVFMDSATTTGTVGGTVAAGHTVHIVFTGSYIAGSPYTLSYTTVAGDAGNTSALASHLNTAINADTTLIAANISSDVSFATLSIIYNRNAGSGTTFSASSTGSETISFGTCVASSITGGLCTFVYNAVLGGWLCTVGGLRSGFPVPTEVLCELANRANVNPWFQIPLLFSQTGVAALAANVRDTLNSNLTALVEVSNEIWNFAETCTTTARNLGACLGFSFQGGIGQFESFFGLRTRQFMAQFATTWTANGRGRSTLKCLMAHSFGAENPNVGGAAQLYRFNGTDLTTTNTTYASLGGLGGTAGTTYTSTGQRPIDVCDGASYATYYSGTLLGNFAVGGWTGLIGTYASILQAGKDYATGGAVNTNSALTALDVDARTGLTAVLTQSKLWEVTYATYDSPRSGLGLNKLEVYCYEGGYESTTGNSFSDSSSPTALANQFTANGWDTSPYGASNTVVAQQVVTVFFAYKNSLQFLLTNELLLSNVVAAHTGRLAYSAWFQFSGPSIWAMYPGDIYTTPYKSFNAFALYNA